MALIAPQVDKLFSPLHPSRVQQDNKGMAHLAAWDIRRWLIRIFGPTGWKIETLSCDLIFEKATQTKAKRDAWYVGYRVHSRLTIFDVKGEELTFFEDGAVGDATLPTLGDAHDMAMKTALSQSLKRCAMNLGDQFGLSLYNNGSTDPVVGRSLAHPAIGESEAADAVQGDTETSSEPEKSSMPTLDDIDRIAGLCERMDAAESLKDLEIVAQEIVNMSPKPSDADLKVLQDTWKERKEALS